MNNAHLDKIVRAVEVICGITCSEMKSKSRKESLVLVRRLIAHIAREQGYSPSIIADYFGVDRSTVYNLFNKGQDNMLKYDKLYKHYYILITSLLNKELNNIKEQVLCVKREIEMRRRLYPNFIKVGKITKEEAEYEINMMNEVLKTLLQIEQQVAAIQGSNSLF